MSGFYVEGKEQKYNSARMDLTIVAVIYIAIKILCYVSFETLRMDIFTVESFILQPFVVAGGYFLVSSKSCISQKLKNKRWNIIKFVLFLIIYLIFLRLGFDNLKKGIGYLTDGYLRLVENTDFLWNIERQDAPGDLVFVILPICFLLSVIYTIVLENKKGFVCLILIQMTPLIVAIIANHIPPFYYIAFSVISMVMLFVCSWEKDTGGLLRSEIVALIALGCLLIFTRINAHIVNDFKTEKSAQYKEIRKSLHDLEKLDFQQVLVNMEGGNFATSGIGKGNLKNIRRINPSKKQVATVVLYSKPKGTIYLKSYVASEYSSEKWNQISGEAVKEQIGLFPTYSDIEAIENNSFKKMQEIQYELEDGSFVNVDYQGAKYDVKADTMYINPITEREDITFIPYHPYMSNIYNYNNELLAENPGEETYAYDYYPLNVADIFTEKKIEDVKIRRYNREMDNYEYLSEEEIIQLMGGEGYSSELWSDYYNYVYTYYLSYPKNISQLNTLIDQINIRKDSGEWMGDEAEFDRILSKDLQYTLNPGATPDGEDFIEHFLKQKKGFCVHFATTATMLYRAMQVPARYVEGYAIPQSAFVYDSDKGRFTATITDEMAHAWCEVFDEYMGWIPKDHTPGSETVAVNREVTKEIETKSEAETTTKKREIESKTTRNEETTKERESMSSTTTKTELPKQTTERKSGRLSYPVIILFGFLVVLGGIISQYWIRRKNKIIKFKRRKDNLGMRYMMQELFRISQIAGVEVNNCTEREAFLRMKKSLSGLQPEEWEWIYERGLVAAFSEERINRVELLEMQKKIRKLKHQVWKSINPLKKIILKMIYAL